MEKRAGRSEKHTFVNRSTRDSMYPKSPSQAEIGRSSIREESILSGSISSTKPVSCKARTRSRAA